LKVSRIDFKQKVAGLDELIVRDVDLNDWTGNTRRNADQVGPGNRVVRAGMSLIEVPRRQA
jgi:hypothetical protein